MTQWHEMDKNGGEKPRKPYPDGDDSGCLPILGLAAIWL